MADRPSPRRRLCFFCHVAVQLFLRHGPLFIGGQGLRGAGILFASFLLCPGTLSGKAGLADRRPGKLQRNDGASVTPHLRLLFMRGPGLVRMAAGQIEPWLQARVRLDAGLPCSAFARAGMAVFHRYPAHDHGRRKPQPVVECLYGFGWFGHLGSPVGFPLSATVLLAMAMLGAGLGMLGRERSGSARYSLRVP